jgi:antitoxin ParD1/3/4
MSVTKSINLTLQDSEMAFLTDMVKSGRFANQAEVLRAGLRLLEDYEYSQKTKRLQALIAEGDADIESGRVTEYASAKGLAGSIIGDRPLKACV